MTEPRPENAMTLEEVSEKLDTQYGDALRILGEEKGSDVAAELKRQLIHHRITDAEDVADMLEYARGGHVVPYHGPTAPELATTFAKILEALRAAPEGALAIVPPRPLIELFEDSAEAIKEHYPDDAGTTLDYRPCQSELVAGELAQSMLDRFQQQGSVDPSDPGIGECTVVIKLNQTGEVRPFSKTGSLTELTSSLRNLATLFDDIIKVDG